MTVLSTGAEKRITDALIKTNLALDAVIKANKQQLAAKSALRLAIKGPTSLGNTSITGKVTLARTDGRQVITPYRSYLAVDISWLDFLATQPAADYIQKEWDETKQGVLLRSPVIRRGKEA
jgi:hypothetical protein